MAEETVLICADCVFCEPWPEAEQFELRTWSTVNVEMRHLNDIDSKSARLRVSMIIDCKSVAKIRRNLTECAKILCVLTVSCLELDI